jgi:uncharacterized membrane protein YciS (DUF1049 family)
VDRLNLGQRVVIVVALGVVLVLVGRYLTAPVPFTGWIAYAPLTASTLPGRLFAARDGLGHIANFFVWLGLVLAWCAASLALLRTPLRQRRGTAARAAEPGSSSADV